MQPDDLVSKFTAESADDEGNAQCVYALVGDKFAYVDAWGWMHYNGTHWRMDKAEADIDRACVYTLKQRLDAAVGKNEAVVRASVPTARHIRDAKWMFRSLVTMPTSSFDASPDELNVKNGVLNLRTGELHPHSPNQRFTYCIPIDYNPDADPTFWTDFLSTTIDGGPEMLDYLQMAMGYAITGHTSEECLWYIHGPTRSGKGTFTETLLALFGEPLSTEVDFSVFVAKREGDSQNFDLAGLMPCRVVFTSESNRYETLNTGKVKQLTGGNMVRAAFKHRDLFTYRPQFKAFLVSNQPVNADVDDDAVWYRVKVLRFPKSRAGAEDKTLKERMKQPTNLAGVLRWLVDGAKRWYQSPTGLLHPMQVEANTNEHRAELDMVASWLAENCIESPTTWTTSSAIFKAYEAWCHANGVPPKAQRSLTLSLKAKGFATTVEWKDGRNQRVVQGISLRATV